jgi:hypothetical protein
VLVRFHILVLCLFVPFGLQAAKVQKNSVASKRNVKKISLAGIARLKFPDEMGVF